MYGLIFLWAYEEETAKRMYPQESSRYAVVLCLLKRLEKRERLCLIELAVWKATCLIHMPKLKNNDYLDFLQWSTHGWKAIKAAHKGDARIDIVIQSVAPFMN